MPLEQMPKAGMAHQPRQVRRPLVQHEVMAYQYASTCSPKRCRGCARSDVLGRAGELKAEGVRHGGERSLG